jgi:hypothetical protein
VNFVNRGCSVQFPKSDTGFLVLIRGLWGDLSKKKQRFFAPRNRARPESAREPKKWINAPAFLFIEAIQKIF